jgi:hypothetical protein
MLLLLMLLNNNPSHTLGIGIGSYPAGTLSLKFCSAPATVFQLTAGFAGWGSYHHEYSSEMAIGGRALFGINSGGSSVKYTHFLGAGAGIDFHRSGIWIIGEGFYECEFFPSPEIPLSIELGVGLGFILGDLPGWVPLLGIHYYLK